jgi:hypothetical protein
VRLVPGYKKPLAWRGASGADRGPRGPGRAYVISTRLLRPVTALVDMV